MKCKTLLKRFGIEITLGWDGWRSTHQGVWLVLGCHKSASSQPEPPKESVVIRLHENNRVVSDSTNDFSYHSDGEYLWLDSRPNPTFRQGIKMSKVKSIGLEVR